MPDDCDARLVFRGDRLAAIISQLGDLHNGLTERWFVEAVFEDVPMPKPGPFSALAEIEAWIGPARRTAANNNER
ncbi:MAG TPA: hypothetical protein VF592_01835 [Sphingomonas sp.]|uniref:hypothetical protein n=1 Tax=Sphingomonas sp. TaxID=28214 RepID=UPI002ED7EC24